MQILLALLLSENIHENHAGNDEMPKHVVAIYQIPKDRRMHFFLAVWNFKVSFNIVYRMLYSIPPGRVNDIFFLI